MTMPMTKGQGWLPDLPDARDYAVDSEEISELWNTLGGEAATAKNLPSDVDLREFFPPVYDQAGLNTSTIHACVGLLQYFFVRAFGKTIFPSRMFLYQTALRMSAAERGAGVSFRLLWKAIRNHGIPPEKYWPYSADMLTQVPDSFLYSYAYTYRGIRYCRVDRWDASGEHTLNSVRSLLAAGFPVVFGFSTPSSISRDGDIPFRPLFDHVQGGHAVIAVGYDDNRRSLTRGYLQIRNSWGEDWGDGGYGWLPYAYVRKGLARDFWTLLHPDWLASGEFARPMFSEFRESQS
ncbi:MAG: C1 family peptidase [Planctomycetales bacterium]|nr:C1 family peptidase [Planctomycetales bacterium]